MSRWEPLAQSPATTDMWQGPLSASPQCSGQLRLRRGDLTSWIVAVLWTRRPVCIPHPVGHRHLLVVRAFAVFPNIMTGAVVDAAGLVPWLLRLGLRRPSRQRRSDALRRNDQVRIQAMPVAQCVRPALPMADQVNAGFSRTLGSAFEVSLDEGFDCLVGGVVALLLRGRLHEVRRCGDQGTADAAIESDLRRTDGVDDDAGRVR